ncbi:MAG: hypothetical protein ACOC9E_03945 [Chloroflexota bacterium]
MSQNELISWKTLSGETTTVQGYRVTPQVQSLHLNLPFGGFVWSRPVALMVEKEGMRERVPIIDATRIAQLFIYLAATVLIWRRWRSGAREVK